MSKTEKPADDKKVEETKVETPKAEEAKAETKEESAQESAPVLVAPGSVRAKFVCGYIKTHEAGSKDVHMHAVTTGSSENKEFSQYTPVGQFMIQIAPGKAAGLFFEAGKEYFFDITAAPAPEATEA